MAISDNNNLIYWDKEQYLMNIRGKWKCSFICKDDNDNVAAYSINSMMHQGFIHIHRFCVGINDQRFGYGELLLGEITKLAKTENQVVSLNVHKNNKVAINFYLKFGFIVSSYDDKQIKMIFKNNDANKR